MKKILGLGAAGALAVLWFASCASNEPDEAAENSDQAASEAVTWFTAQSVADGVWRIDDHGGDNIYLVEGDDQALLIDTGTGIADLAAFARTLTEKPLIVVNTHGHPDHAGGNFQFDEVYGHPADAEMARQVSTRESHASSVQRTIERAPEFESLVLGEDADFRSTVLQPVEAGTRFELGGRTLEVIEVPGHTPGSICLLDGANRLLFAGDNSNLLVWLFLDASLPLEVYEQTLQKLNARAGEFDTVFPGHGAPLDTAFIGEQIACVKSILDGTCEAKPYQSFAGDAAQCSYERATVAFDPNKLRASQLD